VLSHRAVRPAENAAMFPTRCRFCDFSNPPDAKFCSECGGAMHLVPCPNCGAVNEVSALACYQCRTQLRERGIDAPPSDTPVAVQPAVPPRHRPSVLVVLAGILATLAVGVYAFRQASQSDVSGADAASAEIGNVGQRPAVGAIESPAVAPAPQLKREAVTRSDGAGTQPAVAPRPAPAGAAASKTRAERARAEPRRTGAEPSSLPGGGRRLNASSRPRACPEGVAALDLCAESPAQQPAPATAAAGQAAPAKPEPVGSQVCAEGVRALGLCPPVIIQGRE